MCGSREAARADFDLLLRLMARRLGALSDSEVALAVAGVLALYDQLARRQHVENDRVVAHIPEKEEQARC